MSPESENIDVNDLEKADDLIEFAQVRTFFTDTLKNIWDLKKGVDKKATIAEINLKKSLSGANAWMLMCSIIIASIGLDRNSPAVIIGAMLISPLMSPILGIGLGVGINDKRVLKTSLLHFSVAIMIAILVSTLYFTITPLGIYGSEIEARTEPTALDILIAFFGGVAGIISIARKDISTTIPGVAIATALMPPLCVTGYGIANWDIDIMFNSFYLFFSNTFFICLATYLIVRLLKFPFKKYPNKKEKRRNVIYVSIFSLLVSIPSLMILNKVINHVDVERNIEKMLIAEFGEEKQYLDDYKLIQGDSTDVVILKVYGNGNSSILEARCQEKLKALGMKNLDVKVLFTSEVNLNQFDNLKKQLNNKAKDKRFRDSLENLQNQNTLKVLTLQEELKKNLIDTLAFNDICETTKIKFPQLERIAIGNLSMRDFGSTSQDKITAATVEWKDSISVSDQDSLENTLKVYLEGYLRKQNITILKE